MSIHHVGIIASGGKVGGGGDPYFANVTHLMEFGPNYNAGIYDYGPNNEQVKPLGVNNQEAAGKFGTPFFSSPSDSTTSSHGTFVVTDTAHMDMGSGDFTVECFFAGTEPADGATNVPIIARQRSSGTRRSWFLGYTRNNAANDRNFVIGVSSTGTSDLTGSFRLGTVNNDGWTAAQIFDGNWHHLAMVRSGNTVTLYVDGVASNAARRITIGASALYHNTAVPLTIGCYPNQDLPALGAGSGYAGLKLDEVRVTKYARYTADFTPPAVPYGRNATDDPHYNDIILMCGFDEPRGMFRQYGSTGLNALISGRGSSTEQFDAYGLVSAGNVLKVANNTGFNFGNGDFTVEAIVKTGSNVALSTNLISVMGTSGNYSWALGIVSANTMNFRYSLDGTNITTVALGTLAVDTEYTVAVSRVGSNLYCYLNGTLITTHNISTGTLFASTRELEQGGSAAGFIVQASRITKGVGRYTGSTMPGISVPFPKS